MRTTVLLLALLLPLALPAQSVTKPTAPAKTDPAKKTVPAKKAEPESKIMGVVIPRPNGGFLGLALENNGFKLSFYDAKKKPAAVDVTRATARWSVKYQPGPERTVLSPGGDGTSLYSAKTVRPPYNFRVFLTLLQGEGDEAKAVETYNVDFSP